MADDLLPWSEEEVERATDAMYGSLPWSSFWSRDDAKALCRAALSALPRVDRAGIVEEWQPIETAPKDGTAILGASKTPNSRGRRVAVVWCWHRIWNCADYPGMEPTHWRPLPMPPEPSASDAGEDPAHSRAAPESNV